MTTFREAIRLAAALSCALTLALLAALVAGCDGGWKCKSSLDRHESDKSYTKTITESCER